MSYCRWSCMDGLCDVYAYESDEGYQVHLSSKRIMGPQPYVPYLEFSKDQVTSEEFFEAYQLYMKALENSAYVNNNLPYGMESCCCESLEHFLSKMLELREVGYLFPDYVIETIIEEMNEEWRCSDGS